MEKVGLRILHISDLHFGKDSILADAFGLEVFDDFLSLMEDTFEIILKEEEVHALIISGDILSKGEKADYNNEFLRKIIGFFAEKKIPVIISCGNHDLEREFIESNKQFDSFVTFIQNNTKQLNTKLFKNFTTNQAMYVYIEECNTFIISFNSCKHIKLELIDESLKEKYNQEDLMKFYRKDYLDVGMIKHRDIKDCFNELRSLYGNNIVKYSNKIVVSHHSLNSLEESSISIKKLNEENVKLIISGHIHHAKRMLHKEGEIINYSAGSLLSKKDSRSDNKNLIVNPPQFNYYNINLNSNEIIAFTYKYSDKKEWIKQIESKNSISLISSYNATNWLKKFNCEPLNNYFKEEGIIRVYDAESSIFDYYLLNKKGIITNCWIIKNSDTQEKADMITKWIGNRYVDIMGNKVNIIIINITIKYGLQFPEQLLIECK